MSRRFKQYGVQQAIAMVVLGLYATVACGINLFHSDDCPVLADDAAPSDDSCPACRFLAGANSTKVLPDWSPPALKPEIMPIVAPPSSAITSRPWTSSIVRRGPPSLTPA